MWKEYKEYLNNNPKGYWFKAKIYGWGWTPVKWQGWLVIFIFILLIVLNAFRIDTNSHSASDTLVNFLPQTAILVLILIYICHKKGEKPHWSWGLKDKNKK